MSEWITDRLPTPHDCRYAKKTLHYEHVWVMYNGEVEWCFIQDVAEGCPWHPIVIEKPEPYVAAKSKPTSKCSVWHEPFDFDKKYEWYVLCHGTRLADNIPTREAAERIAAIYNEVMP